jgi:predicted PurR-regulated permease PerM
MIELKFNYRYNLFMHTPNRPKLSSQAKTILVLLVLAAFIYLMRQFNEVIGPIVLAIILAYILYPLANRIEKWLKLPRALAVLIVYFLLLLFVGGVLTIVIPILVNRVAGTELNLDELQRQISSLIGGEFTIFDFTINGQEILTRVVDTLQQILEPVVGHTLDLVTGIVSSLVWVIFILIISFYLVKDGEQLGERFGQLVPPGFRTDYNDLRLKIGTIWSSFFRGQLLLSILVMVILTAIGYTIGLPYALPMGILGGLLEVFPSIGHGIWLVLASLLALIRGSLWIPIPNWAFMLIVIGVHVLFTQTDLNYLIPRIIGRSVHLTPLVVILGIVAGAALAGVLGVVLAAPTIATLRVLGRYLYTLVFEIEPFTEAQTIESLPPPDLHWWRKYRNRFPQRKKGA